MLWLYRFFCGYVLVALKGNYSERIINSLVKNGVSVWHIRRKKGEIHADIFARDFIRLAKAKGKSGVKIHILNKVGLPFVIEKYKHRPGLAVGVVLFIAMIFFLSGFIWNVKIEGNQKIEEQSIIDACKQIGIAEGVKAKSINPQNARVELLLKIKGLSWASVNIEGSCVTVNVREYEDPKKDDNLPSNLKATASGVVVSTKVTKGDVCVKPGDTVTKGQLLVSGAVTHADGSTEFVKSEGEVIVETTRTFVQNIDFIQNKKVQNGKVKTLRVLNFFGMQMPLYLGGIKGGFEKELEICKLSADENYAPIYVTKASFYMMDVYDYKITKEQALQLAQSNIEKEILKLDGFEPLSYKDEFFETEKGIEMKRVYVCQENAVKPEILLIDTFN